MLKRTLAYRDNTAIVCGIFGIELKNVVVVTACKTAVTCNNYITALFALTLF